MKLFTALYIISLTAMVFVPFGSGDSAPKSFSAEHNLEMMIGYDTNVNITPSEQEDGVLLYINEKSIWKKDLHPASSVLACDIAYSRNPEFGNPILGLTRYSEDIFSSVFSYDYSWSSASDIFCEWGGSLEYYNGMDDDAWCGKTAHVTGDVSFVPLRDKTFIISAEYSLTDSDNLKGTLDIQMTTAGIAFLLHKGDQYIYLDYELIFSKSEDELYDFRKLGPYLYLSLPCSEHTFSFSLGLEKTQYRNLPSEKSLSFSIEGLHLVQDKIVFIWNYIYNINMAEDPDFSFRQNLFLIGYRILF